MLEFKQNPRPTIGVELELQLIDRDSLVPLSIAGEVIEEIHPSFCERIKKEFLQSMIELNTGICTTVAEVEKDLRNSLEHLDNILALHNATFMSCSLHPFAKVADQKVMNHPRYERIMNDLQLVGRRFICQGLHVHIGIDSAEKAIRVNNTIRIYLPLLLALSTSSPFYEGEITGLMSYRTKLFEALPLAGMPDYLDGWKEFNHVADLLIRGAYIESVRDLWWDVRPHPDFGTVEVRVCDMPVTLRDILSITALIQALVVTIAEEVTYPDPHIQILKANKWQAARYGLEGTFVDPVSGDRSSIVGAIGDLYSFVSPSAGMLGSAHSLAGIPDILRNRTGAHKQLELFSRTGDLKAVAASLLEGFFS